MTLKEFNKELKQYMGVLKNLSPSEDNRAICATYQWKSDTFFRAASIVTAPVAISILAVEHLAFSVTYAFTAIEALVTSTYDTSESLEKSGNLFLKSGKLFLSFVIGALIAILSPIINAVDFIGGGIATLMQGGEDQKRLFN